MLVKNLVDNFLHQNDLLEDDSNVNDYWYRANGDCVCDFCQRFYKDHQYYLGSHDHQICNGDVVHL